MRTLTRSLIAGAAALAFVALPATASADPSGWCKGPGPCTVAPTAAAQTEAPDGWCVLPTDICRRY